MTDTKELDGLPGLGQVDGKRIVVVGCGEGRVVRLVSAAGARAVGVEANTQRLASARVVPPEANETYVEGDGANLPFDDASASVILYFGTLHHVANDGQAQAVAEAARVLEPGGLAYITEPLAEGPYFDLLQPVDDETKVRANAYKAIKGATAVGLHEEQELPYNRVMRFADFEAFHSLVLTIGPDRAQHFSTIEEEMRRRFNHHGRAETGGRAFDQPFRANLLRKI
jgi:ubiquinone/menaquinone biosynthesis C-methylase UbiE